MSFDPYGDEALAALGGLDDPACPLCGRHGGNHMPGCDGDDYDPPQRCGECGGRNTYGQRNACLGCGGRGWA